MKVRYTKTSHYNAVGANERSEGIQEKIYYAYDFYKEDGEWNAKGKGPVR